MFYYFILNPFCSCQKVKDPILPKLLIDGHISIATRQLMPCHKDPIRKNNFLIKSGWLTTRSKEVISEQINIKSLILKRLAPAHSDIGMNCKVEPLRWPGGFCHVWTDPGKPRPVRCCHAFLIEQHDKYM